MAQLVVCYNPNTETFNFRCEPSGTAVPSTATLGNITGLNVSCDGAIINIAGFQNLSDGKPVVGTIVKYELNGSGSILTSPIQVDNTGACPS